MQNFIKTIINAVQSWTKKEIKNSTADWSQNDASAVDYVKNRTHYRENVVIVPNTSVSQQFHLFDNIAEDITENEIYQVIFDDEIYECCATSGRFTSINDQQYFFIEYYENNIILYLLDNEEHTISIQGPSIKKLQSIYMPDDIFTRQRSFNFGYNTTASGDSSHAEGNSTTASGSNSHAEGSDTTASGDSSHAEGISTTASGSNSHAECSSTTASGYSSHAEGLYTIASGNYSHAEGDRTIASGDYSHAEGTYNDTGNFQYGFNTDSGRISVENVKNYMLSKNYTFNPFIGKFKLCEPIVTITNEDNLNSYLGFAVFISENEVHIINSISTKYLYTRRLVPSTNGRCKGYLHSVGNGFGESIRSNAHTIDYCGVGWFKSGLQVGGNAQDDGAKNVLLDGDAIPVPSSAQVGQTIVVSEVDENGKPTKWEAADAGGITEETDPTVPAWAKAPEKPRYTAAEVGALPADTEIPVVPAKVSAFDNDKGYLTEQNLSGYAKSEDIPTKPSDIGAQPTGNYATKDAIPTTLPNPHKLTFSGAVSAEYDGSEAVEVVIPQGGGGGGEVYELLATVTTTEDVEMVEITECDDGTPLLAKELLIRTYIAAGTAKCNIWVGSTCYRWLKGADGIFQDIKQCTWYDSVQHVNGIDTSTVDRWTKLIHHYKKDVGVMYEKWKSFASTNMDVFEVYDGLGLRRLGSTYYAREEGFDHVYVKTNNVATALIPAGSKITVYGVRA